MSVYEITVTRNTIEQRVVSNHAVVTIEAGSFEDAARRAEVFIGDEDLVEAAVDDWGPADFGHSDDLQVDYMIDGPPRVTSADTSADITIEDIDEIEEENTDEEQA